MHRTIAAYFKFSYERNRLNFTWIGPFDVVYIEMGTYLSAVWFSWTSINLSSSKEILCCYIFPVQSSRDGSNCFSKGSGNFVLLCGNFRAEETVGSGIGSPFIDEIQEGLGNSGAQSADEAGVFCAVPPTACNRGKLHPPNRSVKFCCSRRCDKKEEKTKFFLFDARARVQLLDLCLFETIRKLRIHPNWRDRSKKIQHDPLSYYMNHHHHVHYVTATGRNEI